MNNKQPKVAAIIVAVGDSQRADGIGKVVYEG
jgi:hypothetical protein